MSRRVLGKGLSALIGDAEAAPQPDASLRRIPANLLDPNPFQPRRQFADAQLAELAGSIRSSGIVQPVLVRRVGERYQLIAGERRWRASLLAGIESIPAVVRDLSDRDALETALAENLLREDLSALEVAHAYETMHQQFGYSHEQIAERLGVDRSTVSNSLRLLKLPKEVQALLEQNRISPGHARALLACQDPAAQLRLARLVSEDALTVRQVERIAAAASKPTAVKYPGSTEAAVQAASEKAQDPNIRSAIRDLERALGTRVKINGDAERGRIEISYYSAQDLNRLYESIMRIS